MTRIYYKLQHNGIGMSNSLVSICCSFDCLLLHAQVHIIRSIADVEHYYLCIKHNFGYLFVSRTAQQFQIQHSESNFYRSRSACTYFERTFNDSMLIICQWMDALASTESCVYHPCVRFHWQTMRACVHWTCMCKMVELNVILIEIRLTAINTNE